MEKAADTPVISRPKRWEQTPTPYTGDEGVERTSKEKQKPHNHQVAKLTRHDKTITRETDGVGGGQHPALACGKHGEVGQRVAGYIHRGSVLLAGADVPITSRRHPMRIRMDHVVATGGEGAG